MLSRVAGLKRVEILVEGGRIGVVTAAFLLGAIHGRACRPRASTG